MLLEKVGLLVFVSNRYCFDRHMPRSGSKLVNKENSIGNTMKSVTFYINYLLNTCKMSGNPDAKKTHN